MLQRESLVFYKSFNNLWLVVHRKVPKLCVRVSPYDAEDWIGDVEGGSVTVDLVYSMYMTVSIRQACPFAGYSSHPFRNYISCKPYLIYGMVR
jgi:hypothetical protein